MYEFRRMEEEFEELMRIEEDAITARGYQPQVRMYVYVNTLSLNITICTYIHTYVRTY